MTVAGGHESRFLRVQVLDDRAAVEVLRDRLTEEDNIEQFGHELSALVDKLNLRKIVLSLRNVRYLTSSVIGKVIMLHRRLGRESGRLILSELQPEVAGILAASHLLTYFETSPTAATALEALNAPAPSGTVDVR
jgi:anti-anti-sigma factor